VHGITVAFGFTLIGVVQDYPIHLFSHQHAGLSPRQSARALWPTLATGVASTCIAYVTFLASGVDGLKQLAVFTIAGLLTAALTTRFLLPWLIDPTPHDVADSKRLASLWMQIQRLPRPRLSLIALAVIALVVTIFAPGAFWQNDLSKLTPVPAAAMARDTHLRSELGAPDVRYVITLGGVDAEAVLRASEKLRPQLGALVRDHAIAGYDLAARYLPSAATHLAVCIERSTCAVAVPRRCLRRIPARRCHRQACRSVDHARPRQHPACRQRWRIAAPAQRTRDGAGVVDGIARPGCSGTCSRRQWCAVA
jgi:predicted exporter